MNESILNLFTIVFACSGFWACVQAFFSNRGKLRQLILGLAFTQIIDSCKFYISRGYITTEEFSELNHYLFEPYLKLGGDGTAQRMIKEVEKLPIKKEDNDD